MGTLQHFVLFEHVTGYGLFRVKEFNEITHNFSAHVNAFIKPVAFLHFESVSESVENVQFISDGILTPTLRHFLRLNVPRSGVLGVSEEKIAKAIMACDFGFQCVWHASIREVLRVIRSNFSRLTRSLATQPGNAFSLAAVGSATETASAGRTKASAVEARARLVVSIARASLQLNMHRQSQVTDSVIVRALRLMDELDASLTRSASRLRQLYGVHFPEICWPGRCCLKDLHLIKLIASYPSRRAINAVDSAQLLGDLFEDEQLVAQVKSLALDSIGVELISDDEENISRFAAHLLKIVELREHHIQLLANKIKVLVPNLNGLLDSILSTSRQLSDEYSFRVGDNLTAPLVAARLIANAGSLVRLATMPTSRILSIGASKAVFRKSGAIAASSTGLLGTSVASTAITATTEKVNTAVELPTVRCLSEVSGKRVTGNVARRKAARLLAAKASLASRADFFRSHNPIERREPSSVADARQSVDDTDSRLESGAFGQRLAHEMQHQLRAWAEANGIHVERKPEQLKRQRERRKKYRKAKRKAWLSRKLTRAAAATTPAGDPQASPSSVGTSLATTRLQVEAMQVGGDEAEDQSLRGGHDNSTSGEESDAEGSGGSSLLKKKLLEFNGARRTSLTEQTDGTPPDSCRPRRSLRIRHVRPQCT